MKYLLIAVLFLSCKKESMQEQVTDRLEKQFGVHLREVNVGNQKGYILKTRYTTPNEAFHWSVPPWEQGPPTDVWTDDNWGTYTGWLMDINCCFHHGTFFWTGSPDNYVFDPDTPNTDDIIGFDTFCWDNCEEICKIKN